MISPKDASIIAIICKFPDLSEEEIQNLVSNLENPANANVCLALANRLEDSELTAEELAKVEEFRASNQERTERVRREEIEARRREQVTPLARNLLKLHEQGKVTTNMLLLYGVQGDIPERHPVLHRDLSQEEKAEIIRERFRQRFGENWERTIGHLVPKWLRHRKEWSITTVDWSKDGF